MLDLIWIPVCGRPEAVHYNVSIELMKVSLTSEYAYLERRKAQVLLQSIFGSDVDIQYCTRKRIRDAGRSVRVAWLTTRLVAILLM